MQRLPPSLREYKKHILIVFWFIVTVRIIIWIVKTKWIKHSNDINVNNDINDTNNNNNNNAIDNNNRCEWNLEPVERTVTANDANEIFNNL